MFDILCSSTQPNLDFIRSNILLEECPLVSSVSTPLIFTPCLNQLMFSPLFKSINVFSGEHFWLQEFCLNEVNHTKSKSTNEKDT